MRTRDGIKKQVVVERKVERGGRHEVGQKPSYMAVFFDKRAVTFEHTSFANSVTLNVLRNSLERIAA